MPRKQDPITRIINDYSALDTSGRSQVDAALRGFRIATTGVPGTTARRSPVTPRVSKPVAIQPVSENN